MKRLLAVFMGLALLSSVSMSQELERVYWGFSNTSAEPDENTIKEERSQYAESSLGWNNANTWRTDNWGGPKLYRGIVNNGYTATEVGLAFLGDMNFVTQGYNNNQNRRMYEERSSRAIYVDKLKYWGESETVKLFGRLGLALVKTEVESRVYDGGNTFNTYKDSEIVVKAGAGLQWRLGNDWHIRTEVENYFGVGDGSNIPETDITVFSVGVLRHF
jgi:hypothetical protein